ncbi:phytanoyl-CoA dioxygenase family protein [Aspergillus lucknowensis]|uniref:Phytanoyl-CoA dioxygenase n=1 Tax=Aspergillus lucknowensis TaxID=176173 RepID=A0ABR4M547_9EURO
MNQLVFKTPAVLGRLCQTRSVSTQLGKLTSHPISIRPSNGEIRNARLSPQNLEVAMRSLHRDGLVVVENVVSHGCLDRLNEKMIEDAYSLQAKKGNSPYNYNRGNIQQDAPPVMKHFEPSIFLNPIATQITSSALGPSPKWTFCSGNSAMPPTRDSPPMSQPVHSDADFAHPSHPFAYVVNIPLITMTPENGSTEVWLGTHADTGLHVQEGLHGERASGRIKLDELEKRRAIRPPCQPVVPKGSIVVRDLRLWHAGVGNQTETPRVMLALIHFASWYRNPMKLELADDLKPLIEGHRDLEIPVSWVSESEATSRYLNRGFGNAYDFNQHP